jgi:8-oxo-dGTP pyrophosphatase MutT (NUDIX family)
MHEVAAGGLVRRDGLVLLILDAYGRWTFPKGHVEAGESLEETARREVREETGVEAEPIGAPRVVHYQVATRGTTKEVHFFPMRYHGGTAHPLAGEVAEVAWLPYEEALARLQEAGYAGYAALLPELFRDAG